VLAALAALSGRAAAESDDELCWQSQLDPVPTPLRDGGIDGQPGGCLRAEAAVRLIAVAEIDTPGFYGHLGGGLAVAGRFLVAPTVEVGGELRAVDALYVQNAVIKTTDLAYGPLVVHAAIGRPLAGGQLALRVDAEVPGSRADTATFRVAGGVTAAYSAFVGPRLVVHARLGGLASYASSSGGSTARGMGRLGGDLVWWARPSLAVAVGLDLQAGWYHGFDDTMVRVALHGRLRGGWRAQLGIGAPLLGAERANAAVTLGVLRDLD
jgi:hypothetical protein